MISTAALCLFLLHSSLAFLETEDSYPDANSIDYFYAEETPEENDIEVERRDGDKFLRFGRKGIECVDGRCRTEDDALKPTTRVFRDKNDHYIRFGRSKQQDFLRFGRSDKHITPSPQRRTPTDFLRFGRRAPEDGHRINKREVEEPTHGFAKRSGGSDFMRFGRNSNFMRFGRNSQNQLELLERMKLVQYNLMLVMNEITKYLRENDKKCSGN